ncbi:MAG: helix-turn-helix domain-containing protein [Clostridia bacterium]|nr:helix-turn-helix domain-containing protein [Clostridia bacterium]
METKDVIYELRTKKGLSQEELAAKVFVTRQAVSRWETGETLPSSETLKLLSRLFDVSINTLLGAPRRLVCQCCGMPITDDLVGRDADGSLNEEYCKWCYADGEYTYHDMDDLIDVCVKHMAGAGFTEENAREYMKGLLPTLNYWKNHAAANSDGKFEALKIKLIDEINALAIPEMPHVEKLNALVGAYVNLAYPLPSGEKAKFLSDGATYLGTELRWREDRCFGVLANADFILICAYGEGGKDPELLLYKKR